MTLTPWSDIESDYWDALLIGNGASIAVADSLRYNSLFSAARDEGFLSDGINEIFGHFETFDFELVLRLVANAHIINRCLDIDEHETRETYNEIKHALIRTVRATHPEHEKVRRRLTPISKFLARFDTVFSLNYDLLVYWAMMHGNKRAGGNLFKDCFLGDTFTEDFEYLRQPHNDLDSATLVFYPHGNLALLSDLYGTETKISAGLTDLITTIARSWKLGKTVPLFVSEGSHKAKLQAIRRNNYLSTAYREIAKKRESLVIFGWAAAEQDTHILEALARSNPSRVALSVYTGYDDWEDDYLIARRRIRRTFNSRTKIVYFDSADDGVWLNCV